jgi:charged multivesicular body protein 6
MGGIFSKDKKDSRINSHDKAVLDLKLQRDKLQQYQKRIELTLETDRQMAKKLLSEGKKDRAKLLLRKKKYQESLLTRTDGQLDNLQTLVNDLEFAQVEQQVVNGLKTGNEALKKANEMLSITEIEQIMDDTAEAIEKQKEIDLLISGQLSAEDEDDVLAELDELVAAEANEAEVEKDITLPEVPTEEPASTENPVVKEKKKQKQKVAMEAA